MPDPNNINTVTAAIREFICILCLACFSHGEVCPLQTYGQYGLRALIAEVYMVRNQTLFADAHSVAGRSRRSAEFGVS